MRHAVQVFPGRVRNSWLSLVAGLLALTVSGASYAATRDTGPVLGDAMRPQPQATSEGISDAQQELSNKLALTNNTEASEDTSVDVAQRYYRRYYRPYYNYYYPRWYGYSPYYYPYYGGYGYGYQPYYGYYGSGIRLGPLYFSW